MIIKRSNRVHPVDAISRFSLSDFGISNSDIELRQLSFLTGKNDSAMIVDYSDRSIATQF
ncbi:MAG: hypothetical protein WA793_06595 [Sphingorhabdus sp.]|uniref:hypothetical protein n=1 Tax=Sphingorhabdus sp. TaxID=1902408 RepID=UPI003C9365E9